MIALKKIHSYRNSVTGRTHCGRDLPIEKARPFPLNFDHWLDHSDACRSCLRSYAKWRREGPR